jgi:HSP20 family protein
MNYPVRPKWDPFAGWQSLRAELARMFGAASTGIGGAGMLPVVELDPDDEGWTVTARLPGVALEEVALEVDRRELRIRARTVAETEQATGVPEGEPGGPRPGNGVRREFDYGLRLPADVDVDRVDATMDHGLLTVRLPRASGGARRQITIGRHADQPEHGVGGRGTSAERRPAGS